MIQICNYQFEGPFHNTTQIRNASGVYAILCKDSLNTNKHFVHDVGEAGDVRERIENHDRKECWNRNCSTTLSAAVYYTSGMTANERRSIEKQIRNEYNPPCGER